MKLWIARDFVGDLYLFNKKPLLKNNLYWYLPNDHNTRLDSKAFPEVTFENSPQEVELKLVKEL